MSSQRESVKVLQECIDLQVRKSQDYQNPNSNIKQAMHYRRGVSSIHDMIAQKLLRAQSLIEPQENGENRAPNFESLEDTYKDLINYASFAVSFIRGKMEGQDTTRDMFNRPLHDGHGQMEETLELEQPLITSVSGKVEQDGFVTLYPRFADKGSEQLLAVANTYRSTVSNIGPIKYPPKNEIDETIKDSVARTYEQVSDVGTRMDEDMTDHANAIASQGQ